jgi:hormone-sensitive lipase
MSATDLDVNFKTRLIKEAKPKTHQVKCCFCFRRTIRIPEPVITIEKIIVHIHGGGFISMDSSSHQNYTR